MKLESSDRMGSHDQMESRSHPDNYFYLLQFLYGLAKQTTNYQASCDVKLKPHGRMEIK